MFLLQKYFFRNDKDFQKKNFGCLREKRYFCKRSINDNKVKLKQHNNEKNN